MKNNIKVGSKLTEEFKIESLHGQDQYKISGTALPLNKLSRNGVVYENVTFDVTVPLAYNHNLDAIIGNATLQNVGNELIFEAKLNEKVEKARTVWENIKHGDILHVSVGVMATEGSYNEDYTQFTVTQGELYELSVVPAPGFTDAKIRTVEKIEDDEEEDDKEDDTKDDKEEPDTENPDTEEPDTEDPDKKDPEDDEETPKKTKNKEAIMPTEIKTLSEAYSLQTELEKRIKTVQESKQNAENDIALNSKDMTSEEKEAVVKKVEGFKAQLAENKEKLTNLEESIQNMEQEDSRVFRSIGMENFKGGNKALKSDETSFLESIQNLSFKENTAGTTAAMPVSIASDIITEVADTPSLISMVTKNFNATNITEYIIGATDGKVSRGEYDEPTCAVKATITVDKIAIKLGTLGTFITVSDAERNKTIPQFRAWFIQACALSIVENLDYDLIQGNSVNAAGLYYGLQGIASTKQKALGKVATIEYTIADGINYDVLNQLFYATKKATAIAMTRKTQGIIAGLTTEAGNPLFPIGVNGRYQTIGGLNVVINSQMAELETSTAGEPAIIVGNMPSYRADFAKGTMIEVGATPIDKCRNNDIYAYSDCSGSIVETEMFAVLEGK